MQKKIDESTKMIKKLAEEQKIEIQLTKEQYKVLEKGWNNWDTTKPAQIKFIVEGKDEAELKVAAYTYRGSTCCA